MSNLRGYVQLPPVQSSSILATFQTKSRFSEFPCLYMSSLSQTFIIAEGCKKYSLTILYVSIMYINNHLCEKKTQGRYSDESNMTIHPHTLITATVTRTWTDTMLQLSDRFFFHSSLTWPKDSIRHTLSHLTDAKSLKILTKCF